MVLEMIRAYHTNHHLNDDRSNSTLSHWEFRRQNSGVSIDCVSRSARYLAFLLNSDY